MLSNVFATEEPALCLITFFCLKIEHHRCTRKILADPTKHTAESMMHDTMDGGHTDDEMKGSMTRGRGGLATQQLWSVRCPLDI